MPQNRLLVAIMFADIEGYTSLMQKNEAQAILLINKHRKIIDTVTQKYNGELIQYYGDGTLTIFKSSVEAVRCGIEMQHEFQKDPIVPVRIGVHMGDILRTESDIIGNAVNVASRIESLSISGGILISDRVYEQLRNHKDISTKYLDVFGFKNVDKKVLPHKTEVYSKMEELIHDFMIVNYGINPPEGEIYHSIEGSKGELGFYLVSKGEGHPWKCKIRSPSFNNIQSLPKLVVGQMVSDVVAIVGSIDPIMGEADK